MTTQGFPDYMGLLREDPQMAYYSKLFGGGEKLSQGQQRYFSGQGQGEIWNQYLGSLGSGLQSAQQRGLSMTDYLNEDSTKSFYDYLSQTPFTERYAKLAPSLRGQESSTRYAPPVRWVS